MHNFIGSVFNARLRLARLLPGALLSIALGACSGDARQPVEVSLLAVNDFHGYLLPAEQLTMAVPDPDGGPAVEVRVGGAAYLASLVKEFRASNTNSLFIGVGDFVGGAPAISAFTSHESTIEAMNLMGLAVTPVGNHEFDRGKQELKRLQRGGCAAFNPAEPNVRSCARTGSFSGANFPYLAANVVDDDTGQLLFPATHVVRFGNATVGFIGLTLKGTPSTTRGAGGLTFLDEVDVIKTHAERLKRERVDAVVVLLHQGGSTTASSLTNKTCPGLAGNFRDIVEALPSLVDVVLSAHTHADYVCEINGILVSQAGSFGRLATRIDLTIQPGRGVTKKLADNIPVINDKTVSAPRGYTVYQADPEVAALVEAYDTLTRSQREAVVGYVAAPGILRTDIDGDGNLVVSGTRINVADHPVGRVVADAFLAVRGPNNEAPDIALINAGGLRGALPYTASNGGAINYDALFTLAPFGNALYMVEMTGASLIRLLEQQWEAPNCEGRRYKDFCGRLLQVSSSLTYTWRFAPEDQGKPVGSGAMVDPASVRINGQAIDPSRRYKVTTIDYVADGGNYFSVLADPQHRLSLLDLATTDMEALQAYFSRYPSGSPLSAPASRITCRLKATNSLCDIPVL